ncbi:MAG: cysteine desulfurase, partial [Longimicrobiales bacterium]|nr:cysteine desulfurase [Longimicrobiales bacterium]
MLQPVSTFDVNKIRNEFPILHQVVNGKPLTYLDSAATSQKPRSVLDVLEKYYREDNANVHRGIHELSRRATLAFEGARNRVASWLGASDPAEVVWTRGTTESINLVAASWGMDQLQAGDEVLLTTMEHHSNIVPWQLVARRTGARLKYIEMDDEGKLRLETLDELLTNRTRLVALTHVSNALGTVNPVSRVIQAAHARGALVLLDGAQAVPHMKVDVRELDADFYAFSSHKMCGPTGIGVLWGRKELLEEMSPYQGGGEMIGIVGRDESTWADIPHKFEAGTPNIAGAVGTAAAVDFMEHVGYPAIREHEAGLLRYALNRLAQIPELTVYGPKDLSERSGVIAFALGDAHPHDIATILDSEGVAIRAGHHCAQLVMKHLGVAATTRASFSLYNTT